MEKYQIRTEYVDRNGVILGVKRYPKIEYTEVIEDLQSQGYSIKEGVKEGNIEYMHEGYFSIGQLEEENIDTIDVYFPEGNHIHGEGIVYQINIIREIPGV